MTYDLWSKKAVYVADAEEADQERFVKELTDMAYEAQDYMLTNQQTIVHRKAKKVAPTREERMLDLDVARSSCDGECQAGSACRKLLEASKKASEKLEDKLKEKNVDTKATKKNMQRDTQDFRTLQNKYNKLESDYLKECVKSQSAEEALKIIKDHLGFGKDDRAMRSPQSPPASKKRGRTKKLSPVRRIMIIMQAGSKLGLTT